MLLYTLMTSLLLCSTTVQSFSCPCYRPEFRNSRHCNRPPPTDCKGSVIDDACGTSKICAKVEGEECGGPWQPAGDDCDVDNGLICTTNLPGAPQDQMYGVCIPSASCPRNFTLHGTKCYQLFTTAVTQSEAVTKCGEITLTHGRRAHLAEPLSKEEDDAIKSIMESKSVASVWLGGNDRETEGTWQWPVAGWGFQKINDEWKRLDGSKVYTGWRGAEPYQEGGISSNSENCMGMFISQFGKGWADLPCSSTKAFMCQTGSTVACFDTLTTCSKSHITGRERAKDDKEIFCQYSWVKNKLCRKYCGVCEGDYKKTTLRRRLPSNNLLRPLLQ